MKFLTIKQYLGSAAMLAALVVAPAALKVSSASALPERVVEELNLTAAQQTELDAIKDDARSQVEDILTDDQLAALEGKTGRERRQAMRDLDLTEDQRAELREVRETSRAAADEVFTDEQRAQLQEFRASRGNRRQR